MMGKTPLSIVKKG